MRGAVAWFNIQKGYGFITPDSGADVFVHIRELESCGIGGLKPSDTVEFEVVPGREGRTCARNIKFIRPAQQTLARVSAEVTA